jgi:prepilin peptidase CpaA
MGRKGMDWVPIFVVCVAVCVAVITDLRSLKVYNWLTIPLLLSGLIFNFASDGFAGGISSGGAVLASLAVLILPYALGVLGAGDVKLIAAIAAWLGATVTFTMAALALFSTAAYALGVLCWQRRLFDSWLYLKLAMFRMQLITRHIALDDGRESVHDIASSPHRRERLIPFSAMLAIGVAVTVIWHFVYG